MGRRRRTSGSAHGCGAFFQCCASCYERFYCGGCDVCTSCGHEKHPAVAPPPGLPAAIAKSEHVPLVDTLSAEVRAALLALLALEPCHVTGLHDPNHTPFRACDIQKGEAWDRAVRALGGDPERPPRRAHDCAWCEERNSDRPDVREQVRATKAWTEGAPYPEEA